ncbi:MAG: FIST N-terminal domain-containing protein [Campylobacterota bacterium]|nr:FIST N-terminal domain-containing protein [Campylobacterota bacterium]
MKVTNINYENLKDFETNLNLSNIDEEQTLIQVFSGLITENELKQISSIIKSKNSNVKFIGTTTSGEIFNGKVGKNSINISIMEFENTTFENKYFKNENNYEMGVDIANTMFKDDTKAMILFIEGLLNNGHDVVDGIGSVNNNIPIAGGMAGDNGAFAKTFIFDNNGVYDNGAVAVSLNSDVLNVFTNYQLNWQAIGKEMTVTKAEKNRLYEIDGIAASQIYKKYLGDKVYNGLPHSAIEFPMLHIESDGLEVCRTFVHKFDEDDSLLTIGNLKVGDKIRLAFGNIDLIINDAAKDMGEYNYFQPEVIFTYSCASRITFLQSDVVKELEPLNNIAPISGFFTYGEIFHQNGKNTLLNISLTMLGLSESDNNEKIQKKETIDSKEIENNFFTDKRSMVLDALTNLSNSVISELDESKKEIEKAHKNTKDSIEYAALLQNALIPENQIINSYCKDHFTFWQPKDTVGGDIYFITELQSKEEILVMVIDGAGHGVPGAFVTMLVKAIETQIVADISSGSLEPSPALILEYFNKSIKTMLKQEKGSRSNAGFDGGVLYYNKKTNECKYAGAKTDLYIINNQSFEIIKSDRKNVGFVRTKIDQQYTEHSISIKDGTKLYLSTDGFYDQEGENNERYGKKEFERLLLKTSIKSMDKQKDEIINIFKEYKKDFEQSEDVTVIGIEF